MTPYEGWSGGAPPENWSRFLSFDVGGASANAMEWVAQDPDSLSIVFYDEIVKTTTNMRELATLALPKMKNIHGVEYNFIAKVGDYENRIALDDMAKYGIRFTNAVKQDKMTSIHRLAGYLHPNPKRPFPAWHPKAGQLGAPLMFITLACKQLAKEIPLQKWKNERSGDSLKDEMDRSVKHDAVDCALYISRILPAPATIAVPKTDEVESGINLQSKLYWEDVKRQKEKQSATAPRQQYNPSHNGGGKWHSHLGF